MLGRSITTPDTANPLITVTDEAQVELGKALDQDASAPRSLRLYFQGFG